jgi:molybdate transport system substrate-binding protein
MQMRHALALLIAAAGCLFSPPSLRSEVTIAAAISLKPVLESARPALAQAAGEPVTFAFGASGTLAAQIRQGAPVDLFLSADRPTAEALAAAGAADKATLTVIASNQLCLVRPKNGPAIAGLVDLTSPAVKRVALGEPKVVPAGEYARQALAGMKLWEPLQTAGKLVTAENVAQVMTLAERGEVEAAFVYKTDALAARNVVTVAAVDPALHAPIEYLAVRVTASRNPAAARVLTAFGEKPFADALRQAGFSPPPATRPATRPAAEDRPPAR